MVRDMVTLGRRRRRVGRRLRPARHARRRLAPVVGADGRLVGILTRSGALRATSTPPPSTTTAGCGSRRPSASTATSAAKAKDLLDAGADVLVIDTAHGHQEKMLDALRAVRALDPGVPVVAGNVVVGRRAPATSSRPAPTSSRSGSAPARCARPG